MICSLIVISMVTSVTWQTNRPLVKYAIQGSKNKWETFVALGLCKTILMLLMRKYITPYMCSRSRKTRAGNGDMSGWFLSRPICIWVSREGLHGLLALKGKRSQPWPFNIQLWDVGVAGREIYFSSLSVYFSPMVSAQRPCCCGVVGIRAN